MSPIWPPYFRRNDAGLGSPLLITWVCYKHAGDAFGSGRIRDGARLSITIQHIQESLCRAHICALAGMAGVNHRAEHAHDYGVDGQFAPVVNRDGRRVTSGYPLDFQAKTTINWEFAKKEIIYDLEVKAYNDMVCREASETTLMLILLCLPKSQAEWHEATSSATTIRHCCYWYVPSGPPSTNATTKRIFIPDSNVLTPEALKALLAAEREKQQNQPS